MTTVTVKTEFLLLGFSEVRELQLVHAALFLLAVLKGNLITPVTILDRSLHNPMFFFLRNLAVTSSGLDLCLNSVILPKSIHSSLSNNKSISFLDCIAQFYLRILFMGSEYFVLTAFSYDHYAIMDRGACGKMAVASLLSGGLIRVLFSVSTFSMSYCRSYAVPQFFCDVPALLMISCSEDRIATELSMITGVALAVVCFLPIVVSYIRIFWAVLRMTATEGWAKAFSNRLPHLTVVIAFFLYRDFRYPQTALGLPHLQPEE